MPTQQKVAAPKLVLGRKWSTIARLRALQWRSKCRECHAYTTEGGSSEVGLGEKVEHDCKASGTSVEVKMPGMSCLHNRRWQLRSWSWGESGARLQGFGHFSGGQNAGNVMPTQQKVATPKLVLGRKWSTIARLR